jgi:nascent polypeptide-associated complex subunit beta
MMKEDGNVIHFSNPKVQASLHANTFAIAGQSEEKPLAEMLPNILNQLMGPDADKLSHFQDFMQKKAAEEGTKGDTGGDDDDVPELVENFEEASKDEV